MIFIDNSMILMMMIRDCIDIVSISIDSQRFNRFYPEEIDKTFIDSNIDQHFFTRKEMLEVIDILADSERVESSEDDDGIKYFEGDYDDFFRRFLLRNEPCIVKNVTKDWKSLLSWTTDGTPNLDYLSESYGEAEVTVANCDQKYYNAQVKTTLKFSEFARYWKSLIENDYPPTEPCLYLKDWHFTKDFPNEDIYRVPPEFSNDWLNEYFTAKEHLNDDYRFVYMGPKGSWTPFHVDVFTSYSWSVNICGEKKWILFPPKEENKLRDKFGSLPYDVSSMADMNNNDKNDVKYYVVHQKAGDAIFVPSGWHHQVWNTLDTISINHNWVNACNISGMLSCMFSNLENVKKEITEFRDTMDDWIDHCQLLLKSCFGMNFNEFDEFISYIADQRKLSLSKKSLLRVYGNWSIGFNHLKYDLKELKDIRTKFMKHPDVALLFKGKENYV